MSTRINPSGQSWLRDLWQTRPGVIVIVVVAFLLAVGLAVAGFTHHSTSAHTGGSGGGAPAQTSNTWYYNDTADQMVVEISGPNSVNLTTNMDSPTGTEVPPQVSTPYTGGYSAICTVSAQDVTWTVWDTSAGSQVSQVVDDECNDLDQLSGASITWNTTN
jgi:uncharacterized iron-regulated membrane protein